MADSRATQIPIDHILAEMASFPFASEASYDIAAHELDTNFLQQQSSDLWRHAEQRIVSVFPSLSLEEAVHLRDAVWALSSKESRRVGMHELLRFIADEYLQLDGEYARPRLPRCWPATSKTPLPLDSLARSAFWWMSLAMPPDLLLPAIVQGHRIPVKIDCLSRPVSQILKDTGFAETHLHLGAAIDFSELWVATICATSDPAFTPDAFCSPGAELGEGKRLANLLLQTNITRTCLALFLWCRRRYAEHRKFRDFLHSKDGSSTCRGLPEILESNGLGDQLSIVLRALADVHSPRQATDEYFDLMKQCVKRTLPHPLPHAREYDGQLDALDPIYDCFADLGGSQTSAEMKFTAEGLRYLRELQASARTDPTFATLFWQVTRLRCIYYRHITQRPLTPGLQWFIRFFERLRTGKRLLGTRRQVHTAAKLCGLRDGLRSLEVRIGADGDRVELKKKLAEIISAFGEITAIRSKELADDASRKRGEKRSTATRGSGGTSQAQSELEFGVVLHFIRQRRHQGTLGSPPAFWRDSFEDPAHHAQRQRFAGAIREYRREAGAIEKLIRDYPRILHIVRGLDVCTDELGVANWVFAPMLRRVHNAANEVSRQVGLTLGESLPTLRTTAHVGEDFVHLLTGLRRIDETIDYFQLREGDRLGHALALGVDPASWVAGTGRVAITKETRLFDLVWQWKSHNRVTDRSASAIEMEINQLIKELFWPLSDLRPQVFEVMQLREDLVNPFMWTVITRSTPHLTPEMGFTDSEHLRMTQGFDRGPYGPRRVELFREFLTNPQLFQLGKQLVWVYPEAEQSALQTLQSDLRSRIARKKLTIEINPTSNLLIGDFGDLVHHPLWRLRPPEARDDLQPISICVGSDDPITFASDLRQEYQRVADALAKVGLSNDEIDLWIERAAQSGLTSRFTQELPDLDSIWQPFDVLLPDRVAETEVRI